MYLNCSSSSNLELIYNNPQKIQKKTNNLAKFALLIYLLCL